MCRYEFLVYKIYFFQEMKREADDPSYEVQVEEDSLTSGGDLTYDVRFELVKTNRGNDNGLAVHEDNGFVRLYRRTSSTGRCSHYRCSTCDHLYEKIGQGERPSIKMRDSIICSDPYPAHNQLCTPTPEEVFRRAQHDLEARQLNACRRILTNVSILQIVEMPGFMKCTIVSRVSSKTSRGLGLEVFLLFLSYKQETRFCAQDADVSGINQEVIRFFFTTEILETSTCVAGQRKWACKLTSRLSRFLLRIHAIES